MQRLTVKSSKKRQVIDITNEIENCLPDSAGVCVVFIKHTTAALTTADLDPGTDLDFLDALGVIVPNLDYRHPHDPSHTPDHITASIIGASVSIPFVNGRLELGTWQRVVLVEFNGPRERELTAVFLKT